jgi:hypothetical protein
MGRVVTPKYAVEIEVRGGPWIFTPAAWHRSYGRPTVANLAAYVAKFEASTKPGGANDSLGVMVVSAARIKLNVLGGAVVATYTEPFAAVPV